MLRSKVRKQASSIAMKRRHGRVRFRGQVLVSKTLCKPLIDIAGSFWKLLT